MAKDMEDVISLSSGSEGDENEIAKKRVNDEHFILIRRKAKEIIFPYPFLRGQLFPYEKFTEFVKEIENSTLERHLASKRAFLWKNILKWVQAMKLSYSELSELKCDAKYNLILTDIMASYINHKSDIGHNKVTTTEIEGRISETLISLQLIFDENPFYIVIALLKINIKKEIACILYPIFRKFLSKRLHQSNELIFYIGLICAFKRWKKIVSAKNDKLEISTIGASVLPPNVPMVDDINRPFSHINDLIGYAIKEKKSGTRILLKKPFDVDETIKKYLKQYEYYVNNYDGLNLCKATELLIIDDDTTPNLNKEPEILHQITKPDLNSCTRTEKAGNNNFAGYKNVENLHLNNNCDISSLSNSNSIINKVKDVSNNNYNLASHMLENNKDCDIKQDIIEIDSSEEEIIGVPCMKQQPKKGDSKNTNIVKPFLIIKSKNKSNNNKNNNKDSKNNSDSNSITSSDNIKEDVIFIDETNIMRKESHKLIKSRRRFSRRDNSNYNNSSSSDDEKSTLHLRKEHKKPHKKTHTKLPMHSICRAVSSNDYHNISKPYIIKKPKSPFVHCEVSSTVPDLRSSDIEEPIAKTTVTQSSNTFEPHSSSSLQSFQNVREVGSRFLSDDNFDYRKRFLECNETGKKVPNTTNLDFNSQGESSFDNNIVINKNERVKQLVVHDQLTASSSVSNSNISIDSQLKDRCSNFSEKSKDEPLETIINTNILNKTTENHIPLGNESDKKFSNQNKKQNGNSIHLAKVDFHKFQKEISVVNDSDSTNPSQANNPTSSCDQSINDNVYKYDCKKGVKILDKCSQENIIETTNERNTRTISNNDTDNDIEVAREKVKASVDIQPEENYLKFSPRTQNASALNENTFIRFPLQKNVLNICDNTENAVTKIIQEEVKNASGKDFVLYKEKLPSEVEPNEIRHKETIEINKSNKTEIPNRKIDEKLDNDKNIGNFSPTVRLLSPIVERKKKNEVCTLFDCLNSLEKVLKGNEQITTSIENDNNPIKESLIVKEINPLDIKQILSTNTDINEQTDNSESTMVQNNSEVGTVLLETLCQRLDKYNTQPKELGKDLENSLNRRVEEASLINPKLGIVKKNAIGIQRQNIYFKEEKFLKASNLVDKDNDKNSENIKNTNLENLSEYERFLEEINSTVKMLDNDEKTSKNINEKNDQSTIEQSEKITECSNSSVTVSAIDEIPKQTDLENLESLKECSNSCVIASTVDDKISKNVNEKLDKTDLYQLESIAECSNSSATVPTVDEIYEKDDTKIHEIGIEHLEEFTEISSSAADHKMSKNEIDIMDKPDLEHVEDVTECFNSNVTVSAIDNEISKNIKEKLDKTDLEQLEEVTRSTNSTETASVVDVIYEKDDTKIHQIGIEHLEEFTEISSSAADHKMSKNEIDIMDKPDLEHVEDVTECFNSNVTVSAIDNEISKNIKEKLDKTDLEQLEEVTGSTNSTETASVVDVIYEKDDTKIHQIGIEHLEEFTEISSSAADHKMSKNEIDIMDKPDLEHVEDVTECFNSNVTVSAIDNEISKNIKEKLDKTDLEQLEEVTGSTNSTETTSVVDDEVFEDGNEKMNKTDLGHLEYVPKCLSSSVIASPVDDKISKNVNEKLDKTDLYQLESIAECSNSSATVDEIYEKDDTKIHEIGIEHLEEFTEISSSAADHKMPKNEIDIIDKPDLEQLESVTECFNSNVTVSGIDDEISKNIKEKLDKMDLEQLEEVTESTNSTVRASVVDDKVSENQNEEMNKTDSVYLENVPKCLSSSVIASPVDDKISKNVNEKLDKTDLYQLESIAEYSNSSATVPTVDEIYEKDDTKIHQMDIEHLEELAETSASPADHKMSKNEIDIMDKPDLEQLESVTECFNPSVTASAIDDEISKNIRQKLDKTNLEHFEEVTGSTNSIVTVSVVDKVSENENEKMNKTNLGHLENVPEYSNSCVVTLPVVDKISKNINKILDKTDIYQLESIAECSKSSVIVPTVDEIYGKDDTKIHQISIEHLEEFTETSASPVGHKMPKNEIDIIDKPDLEQLENVTECFNSTVTASAIDDEISKNINEKLDKMDLEQLEEVTESTNSTVTASVVDDKVSENENEKLNKTDLGHLENIPKCSNSCVTVSPVDKKSKNVNEKLDKADLEQFEDVAESTNISVTASPVDDKVSENRNEKIDTTCLGQLESVTDCFSSIVTASPVDDKICKNVNKIIDRTDLEEVTESTNSTITASLVDDKISINVNEKMDHANSEQLRGVTECSNSYVIAPALDEISEKHNAEIHQMHLEVDTGSCNSMITASPIDDKTPKNENEKMKKPDLEQLKEVTESTNSNASIPTADIKVCENEDEKVDKTNLKQLEENTECLNSTITALVGDDRMSKSLYKKNINQANLKQLENFTESSNSIVTVPAVDNKTIDETNLYQIGNVTECSNPNIIVEECKSIEAEIDRSENNAEKIFNNKNDGNEPLKNIEKPNKMNIDYHNEESSTLSFKNSLGTTLINTGKINKESVITGIIVDPLVDSNNKNAEDGSLRNIENLNNVTDKSDLIKSNPISINNLNLEIDIVNKIDNVQNLTSSENNYQKLENINVNNNKKQIIKIKTGEEANISSSVLKEDDINIVTSYDNDQASWLEYFKLKSKNVLDVSEKSNIKEYHQNYQEHGRRRKPKIVKQILNENNTDQFSKGFIQIPEQNDSVPSFEISNINYSRNSSTQINSSNDEPILDNLKLLAVVSEKYETIPNKIFPSSSTESDKTCYKKINKLKRNKNESLKDVSKLSKIRQKSVRSTRNSCTASEKITIETNVKKALEEYKPKSITRNSKKPVQLTSPINIWQSENTKDILRTIPDNSSYLCYDKKNSLDLEKNQPGINKLLTEKTFMCSQSQSNCSSDSKNINKTVIDISDDLKDFNEQSNLVNKQKKKRQKLLLKKNLNKTFALQQQQQQQKQQNVKKNIEIIDDFSKRIGHGNIASKMLDITDSQTVNYFPQMHMSQHILSQNDVEHVMGKYFPEITLRRTSNERCKDNIEEQNRPKSDDENDDFPIQVNEFLEVSIAEDSSTLEMDSPISSPKQKETLNVVPITYQNLDNTLSYLNNRILPPNIEIYCSQQPIATSATISTQFSKKRSHKSDKSSDTNVKNKLPIEPLTTQIMETNNHYLKLSCKKGTSTKELKNSKLPEKQNKATANGKSICAKKKLKDFISNDIFDTKIEKKLQDLNPKSSKTSNIIEIHNQVRSTVELPSINSDIPCETSLQDMSMSQATEMSNQIRSPKSSETNDIIELHNQVRSTVELPSINSDIPRETSLQDMSMLQATEMSNQIRSPKSSEPSDIIEIHNQVRSTVELPSINSDIPCETSLQNMSMSQATEMSNQIRSPKSSETSDIIEINNQVRSTVELPSINSDIPCETSLQNMSMLQATEMSNQIRSPKSSETNDIIEIHNQVRSTVELPSINSDIPCETSLQDMSMSQATEMSNQIRSPKSSETNDIIELHNQVRSTVELPSINSDIPCETSLQNMSMSQTTEMSNQIRSPKSSETNDIIEIHNQVRSTVELPSINSDIPCETSLQDMSMSQATEMSNQIRSPKSSETNDIIEIHNQVRSTVELPSINSDIPCETSLQDVSISQATEMSNQIRSPKSSETNDIIEINNQVSSTVELPSINSDIPCQISLQDVSMSQATEMSNQIRSPKSSETNDIIEIHNQVSSTVELPSINSDIPCETSLQDTSISQATAMSNKIRSPNCNVISGIEITNSNIETIDIGLNAKNKFAVDSNISSGVLIIERDDVIGNTSDTEDSPETGLTTDNVNKHFKKVISNVINNQEENRNKHEIYKEEISKKQHKDNSDDNNITNEIELDNLCIQESAEILLDKVIVDETKNNSSDNKNITTEIKFNNLCTLEESLFPEIPLNIVLEETIKDNNSDNKSITSDIESNNLCTLKDAKCAKTSSNTVIQEARIHDLVLESTQENVDKKSSLKKATIKTDVLISAVKPIRIYCRTESNQINKIEMINMDAISSPSIVNENKIINDPLKLNKIKYKKTKKIPSIAGNKTPKINSIVDLPIKGEILTTKRCSVRVKKMNLELLKLQLTNSDKNKLRKSMKPSFSPWQKIEHLIMKYMKELNLKKLDQCSLIKLYTSLDRVAKLETYFVFNKILVTFIFECLSSEDCSKVTYGRFYTSLCTKTKQTQSKNIDNNILNEIQHSYQLLMKNSKKFRNLEKIQILDKFIIRFEKYKNELFDNVWLKENKRKIDSYLNLDPIENDLIYFMESSKENDEITIEDNKNSIENPSQTEESRLHNIEKSNDITLKMNDNGEEFVKSLHMHDINQQNEDNKEGLQSQLINPINADLDNNWLSSDDNVSSDIKALIESTTMKLIELNRFERSSNDTDLFSIPENMDKNSTEISFEENSPMEDNTNNGDLCNLLESIFYDLNVPQANDLTVSSQHDYVAKKPLNCMISGNNNIVPSSGKFTPNSKLVNENRTSEQNVDFKFKESLHSNKDALASDIDPFDFLTDTTVFDLESNTSESNFIGDLSDLYIQLNNSTNNKIEPSPSVLQSPTLNLVENKVEHVTSSIMHDNKLDEKILLTPPKKINVKSASNCNDNVANTMEINKKSSTSMLQKLTPTNYVEPSSDISNKGLPQKLKSTSHPLPFWKPRKNSSKDNNCPKNNATTNAFSSSEINTKSVNSQNNVDSKKNDRNLKKTEEISEQLCFHMPVLEEPQIKKINDNICDTTNNIRKKQNPIINTNSTVDKSVLEKSDSSNIVNIISEIGSNLIASDDTLTTLPQHPNSNSLKHSPVSISIGKNVNTKDIFSKKPSQTIMASKNPQSSIKNLSNKSKDLINISSPSLEIDKEIHNYCNSISDNFDDVISESNINTSNSNNVLSPNFNPSILQTIPSMPQTSQKTPITIHSKSVNSAFDKASLLINVPKNNTLLSSNNSHGTVRLDKTSTLIIAPNLRLKKRTQISNVNSANLDAKATTASVWIVPNRNPENLTIQKATELSQNNAKCSSKDSHLKTYSRCLKKSSSLSTSNKQLSVSKLSNNSLSYPNDNNAISISNVKNIEKCEKIINIPKVSVPSVSKHYNPISVIDSNRSISSISDSSYRTPERSNISIVQSKPLATFTSSPSHALDNRKRSSQISIDSHQKQLQKKSKIEEKPYTTTLDKFDKVKYQTPDNIPNIANYKGYRPNKSEVRKETFNKHSPINVNLKPTNICSNVTSGSINRNNKSVSNSLAPDKKDSNRYKPYNYTPQIPQSITHSVPNNYNHNIRNPNLNTNNIPPLLTSLSTSLPTGTVPLDNLPTARSYREHRELKRRLEAAERQNKNRSNTTQQSSSEIFVPSSSDLFPKYSTNLDMYNNSSETKPLRTLKPWDYKQLSNDEILEYYVKQNKLKK